MTTEDKQTETEMKAFIDAAKNVVLHDPADHVIKAHALARVLGLAGCYIQSADGRLPETDLDAFVTVIEEISNLTHRAVALLEERAEGDFYAILTRLEARFERGRQAASADFARNT